MTYLFAQLNSKLKYQAFQLNTNRSQYMHNINKLLILLVLVSDAVAAPLPDFTFKSPSFNGSGYGTYQLTIENEQYTRQQAVLSALQSAQQQAIATAASNPINQFLTNLESRIYAQISQNLATAMFANNNCSAGQPCGGTMNFQGNTIRWSKDPTNPNQILLQVTDNVGNITTITVPLGSFTMTN